MRTIPSPHYERSTLFESDLDKYEAERSLYRNLLRAETAIKEGARKRRHLQLVPSDAGRCHGESCHQGRQPCRERCGAEMGGGTSGDAPTVPTRRLPTKPRLSPMRRLVQWLTELSARIRRA